MATLTIPDVPEDLVARVEAAAQRHQLSLTEEVRSVLEQRYPDRGQLLARIRRRWDRFPVPRAEQIDEWIDAGHK